MKEQLITFETTKLAKEKGCNFGELFPWNYSCYRLSDGKSMNKDVLSKSEQIGDGCLPTQSLLQKWLREKHDIIVEIESSKELESDNGGRDGNITEIKNTLMKFCSKRRGFHYKIFNKGEFHSEGFSGVGYSYEEALETGLQKALKLI